MTDNFRYRIKTHYSLFVSHHPHTHSIGIIANFLAKFFLTYYKRELNMTVLLPCTLVLRYKKITNY